MRMLQKLGSNWIGAIGLSSCVNLNFLNGGNILLTVLILSLNGVVLDCNGGGLPSRRSKNKYRLEKIEVLPLCIMFFTKSYEWNGYDGWLAFTRKKEQVIAARKTGMGEEEEEEEEEEK
ncbi:hypothetical protein K435DRAFT_801761 [Dendrothele bispora CBS 962.96]|uniref:Uncharacterized protein n=1 Tax=Dendrothele bispora (strain CBS 962.96) TaxID=1314807 RepID=A0A4S8LNF6_DENBC|nr:hypothetical protein K435DRAFT_801761 [Dendrothele bispora CBS 962.96]